MNSQPAGNNVYVSYKDGHSLHKCLYRDFIQDVLDTVAGNHNLQTRGQSSLSSSFGWDPLVDLLAGGGEGHILLRAATHVELVDLSQELLGLRWMCGGWIIRHTVQPAMPGE